MTTLYLCNWGINNVLEMKFNWQLKSRELSQQSMTQIHYINIHLKNPMKQTPQPLQFLGEGILKETEETIVTAL